MFSRIGNEQVDYIRDSINEIQVTVDEIKQAQSAIIGSPQPNEGSLICVCSVL